MLDGQGLQRGSLKTACLLEHWSIVKQGLSNLLTVLTGIDANAEIKGNSG